jgi:hypothetical protein
MLDVGRGMWDVSWCVGVFVRWWNVGRGERVTTERANRRSEPGIGGMGGSGTLNVGRGTWEVGQNRGEVNY